VVTLDRRKLAAPLVAQAAAFVAVLVIGGFTGHAATAAPGTGHGATPGPSTAASASVSVSASVGARSSATTGPALKLTVKVVEKGTTGLPVAGSQVNVLQNGTLASVATGTLNSALEFAANVPAGPYQVCVDPPLGWGSADGSTHVLGGWICAAADLRTGPQLVTIRLSPQVPTQVGQ
jgi:hypothetical protein